MNPFDLLNHIRGKSNPFRELSREEKIKQHQKEVEVIEGIKHLAIVSNDMLMDQRYRELARVFQDVEKNIIDLMINCDEADRDKFFLRIKEYQIKLRMFKQILKIPHEFIAEANKVERQEVK